MYKYRSFRKFSVAFLLLVGSFASVSGQFVSPEFSTTPAIDFIDQDGDGRHDLVNGTIEVEILTPGEYVIDLEVYWVDTNELITSSHSEKISLDTGFYNFSRYHNGQIYWREHKAGNVVFLMTASFCGSSSCDTVGISAETSEIIDTDDFDSPQSRIDRGSLMITKHYTDGDISSYLLNGLISSDIETDSRIELMVFRNDTTNLEEIISESADDILSVGDNPFSFEVRTDILWQIGTDVNIYFEVKLLVDIEDALEMVDEATLSQFVDNSELLTPDVLFADPVLVDQQAVNSDDDAFFEQLVVTIGVKPARKTEYYIESGLYAGDGSWLGTYYHRFAFTPEEISAGYAEIDLHFGAGKIRERGDNGTYRLDLQLERSDEETIQNSEVDLSTYTHTDFNPHQLSLIGVSSQPYQLIDVDNDQQIDWVQFNFDMDMKETHNSSIFARFGYTDNDVSYFISSNKYLSTTTTHQAGQQVIHVKVPALDLSRSSTYNLTLDRIGVFDLDLQYFYYLSDISYEYDLDLDDFPREIASQIGTTVKEDDYFNYKLTYNSDYGLHTSLSYNETVIQTNNSQIIVNATYEMVVPISLHRQNRSLLDSTSWYFISQFDPDELNQGRWYPISPPIFDDFAGEYMHIEGIQTLSYHGEDRQVWRGDSGNYHLYIDANTGILLQLELRNGRYSQVLVDSEYDFSGNNPTDEVPDTATSDTGTNNGLVSFPTLQIILIYVGIMVVIRSWYKNYQL